MTDISLSAQIAEVERELVMRRRNYPQWINTGRLRMTTAKRQIELMEAVLATLRNSADEGSDLVDRAEERP
jgi:hypothetical protein